MMRARGVALVCALWVVAWAARARAGDPYLRWYTVVTPHFRIHYHGGLEEIAQRTANSAESVYARLVPQLAWAPKQVTEMVITDDSDSANGSASVLPYNIVNLFASAPDDMSPLADYDNWVNALVTHEYTHILQIDNTSGLPALGNAILGKTYAPNQRQPRWILEGLAVVMETEHTSGGRLRSSQFDMFLRADVLDQRLARLDQISNPARRWPGGNLWYLYGANFIGWIVDTYGPGTYGAVASDYGASVVPWGINRAIRRVTGRTYEQLYEGWRAYLERKYEAQKQAVLARGLRQGRRLTQRGFNASTPVFMPKCGDEPGQRLVYSRDDGNTTSGIYAIDPDAARPDDTAQLLARAGGRGLAVDRDCSLYFDTTAPSNRFYYFGDLFRQPPNTRSPAGTERNRQRLTVGVRASAPDVSPDGRLLTYVTNRAGTSTLRIARLDAERKLEGERALVPSADTEQAYTPRFSPDGQQIAYSAWTRGGYRDIRVVDVRSGAFYELMHDRAIDQQPVWSPDGKTLYFVSDRTGIANVFAYELGSHELRQVTNVLTGAYMPTISADGKRLVYVGYTSYGYDLYDLPLDPSRFLPATEPPDRLPAFEPSISRTWPVESYDPLPTLRPHAWTVAYGQGTFGNTFTIATAGSDAVGLHAFDASLSIPTSEEGVIGGSANYAYNRLPFSFRGGVFHSAAPRNDYRYGNQQILTTELLTGASTGISWAAPGAFDSQAVSLSYTIAKFSRDLPVGTRADPFSLVPYTPDRGYIGSVRLGYAYSNVQGTAYGISGEKGFSIGVALDEAAEALGSESTLTAIGGVATAYQLMPWGRHHVLALALSGGTSTGSYVRRGLYATGGFVDESLFDTYNSVARQSAFVLRGYAPGQFIGTSYNLLNVEYRFPLLYADRGISTLPVFLRTASGVLFFDYGGAYNQLDPNKPFDVFHGSVGAELWLDAITGYYMQTNLRLGIAHPLDDGAPAFKSYAVLVSGF